MNRSQESMIGNSAALSASLDQISQVAPINRPVLILGARGTGKELAAERLHFLSQRWEAPLLKVNCAALSDQLLESELFGHEAGSFTGATSRRKGRFERAHTGTLFLDEVATMSTPVQEKLLRLVEYGEFERLGGQETLQVDVRIIAATNADLPALAQQNKFRHDLLDRLSFDVVHLPSLVQRLEDIVELADHFAIGMCAELGWELFPGFSDRAQQQLVTHSWPGNVRELKNAVERSLYRWAKPQRPVDTIVLNPFKSPFELDASLAPENEPIPNVEQMTTSDVDEVQVTGDFSQRIAAVEKEIIERALVQNGHNQRKTAEALGLSYDQMRGMVRKYKLSQRARRS